MKQHSLEDIRALYHQPIFQLIDQARSVHQHHWHDNEVQLCKLLSIKTGGCSEDCSYCAQSAHHEAHLPAGKLMGCSEILPLAQEAKESGATRFCMGAAWKGIREDDPRFPSILQTVREVRSLGIEVCVTLGSLSQGAADQLKEAGLTAYNHNIDTSPEFYPNIVSTHSFEDRLRTIKHIQNAGISVCCGGIIGMGESEDDRLRMLEELLKFEPLPESIPINCLIPIEGTPLEEQPPVDVFDLVRMVATTRILFPRAKVRLSAGRSEMSREGQALCFYAGANSIFYGDRLLTADNPGECEDQKLLKDLNLVPLAPVPETALA